MHQTLFSSSQPDREIAQNKTIDSQKMVTAVEEERMPALSEAFPDSLNSLFRQYLIDYSLEEEYLKRGRERDINIDDLALTVGKAYEKVRKVIDWKEENALRRGAIYRAIKRSLVGQIYGFDSREVNAKEVGERMLVELMRSGYFNNDLIGVEEEKQFIRIFDKYVPIIMATQKRTQKAKASKDKGAKKDFKKKMKFQTWVLELAACEIEECLAPDFRGEAISQFMIEMMTERMILVGSNKEEVTMPALEKQIQIDLAVNRSLLNQDDAALSYRIIKIRYPFWLETTANNHQEILAKIDEIYDQVQTDLDDERGKAFKAVTDHYDAAYRLVGDINDEINHLREKENQPKNKDENESPPERLSLAEEVSFWQDEPSVLEKLQTIYDERKKSLKKRLLRSAVWSTLSVILSDIVTIIIVEGPMAKLIGQDFTIVSLLADLLIPSALMFALIMLIPLPPKNNYQVVEKEVKKVIYTNQEVDRYPVKLKTKKVHFLSLIFFNFFYVIAALGGVFLIAWTMYIAHIPLTSVFLNTITTTMIFGAWLVIKEQAQEITIRERGHFTGFLLEILSVPLARIGSWFSKKWREYNVVAILFSVLVDTPFSALIGLISDWREYLVESASEIDRN